MDVGRFAEPATGHQLHILACLCQAVGIRELVEEEQLTIGTAGQMIRRLTSERRSQEATIRYGNLKRRQEDLR